MPHLLMSNGSLESAPRPATSDSDSGMQHFQRSPEVDPDLEPLRRQVSDIIDAILADTKPEEAEVRENLRSHVAENPGQPEKALLNHLLSLSVREDISAG
jgi:hypothetical protein